MGEEKGPGGKMEIKSFQPRTLNGSGIGEYAETKKKFGSLSSLEGKEGGAFNLHPASKKYLGVERQEKDHVEGLVRAEVELRVGEIRDAAYQEGLELGRKEGFASAEKEYSEAVRPVQEQFVNLLREFDSIKQEVHAANEGFLIQLVYQISRQVLLKELGTDRDYVKRLIAHVVQKLGAKDHIRVKISKRDSENIEQIKDFLKVEIPDLRNIQIEGSDELALGGCKVETDLSRINATIENQLGSIEKALGEA
jgi:flagellar biosynthesis/type III secretory pathway protein FliH